MPRALLFLLTAFVLGLGLPAQAGAAFTATLSGTTATLSGSDSVKSLTIGASGGLLIHGRATAGDPGFASDSDWDTTVGGDQTIAANDTADIVVALGGGNDVLVPATSNGARSLVVDAGAGDDVLNGSADADTLRGGAGDDRLTGAQGADLLFGGAGDDRFVWNNGDGSDDLAGEEGVTVDAGAGADALTAGDGTQVLRGGPGNDRVTGGGGSDLLAGDDGDDQLDARDGGGDVVGCGAGTDSAVVDAPGVDAVSDCEGLDQTPAPVVQTPAPVVQPPAPVVVRPLGALSVRARQVLRPSSRRVVRLAVACPAGPQPCRGGVELVTRSSFSVRGVRSRVTLGTKAYTLAAGGRSTLSFTLPSRYRRLASSRATRLQLDAVVRGKGAVSVRRARLAIRLR